MRTCMPNALPVFDAAHTYIVAPRSVYMYTWRTSQQPTRHSRCVCVSNHGVCVELKAAFIHSFIHSAIGWVGYNTIYSSPL